MTVYLFIACVLSLSLYTAYLAFEAIRVLLKPRRAPSGLTPQNFGLRFEDVRLQTADALVLAAWFLLPDPSDAKVSGAAVLMLHGHGASKGDMLRQASSLVSAGYFVLLPDFRAHGDSEGMRSSLGMNEAKDVTAAHQYLSARPEVNPDAVAVVGHSLGAAAALCAAEQLKEVRAFVLQAPFATLGASVSCILRDRLGLLGLSFRPLFDLVFRTQTGKRVERVRPVDGLQHLTNATLLFIHADGDDYAVLDNSAQLHHSFQGRKQLLSLECAAQQLVSDVFPQFETRLLDFLEWHLSSSDAYVSNPERPAPTYTMTLDGAHKVFKVGDTQKQTLIFTELAKS